MIIRNELEEDLNSVENYLNDNSPDSNDKLRKALNYLKERTEKNEKKWKENEQYRSDFKQLFLTPIRTHFVKLYKMFEEEKSQGYRPIIKILQLLDLMIQNFDNNPKELESIGKEVHIIIGNFIKQDSDQTIKYPVLRNLNSLDSKLLTLGFMNKLKRIKNAITWKRGTKTIELVESILSTLGKKI